MTWGYGKPNKSARGHVGGVQVASTVDRDDYLKVRGHRRSWSEERAWHNFWKASSVQVKFSRSLVRELDREDIAAIVLKVMERCTAGESGTAKALTQVYAFLIICQFKARHGVITLSSFIVRNLRALALADDMATVELRYVERDPFHAKTQLEAKRADRAREAAGFTKKHAHLAKISRRRSIPVSLTARLPEEAA